MVRDEGGRGPRGEGRDSLVTRTARALAGLSAAAADGAYLGSESELLERLGVSRPTLRQAAKIVESDRLIAVKRGVRGGFFATRPAARDAIRAPALYLRMNGATIGHIHAVTRLIAEEAAAEAAKCGDETLRSEMRALRTSIASDDVADETPAKLIEREGRLAQLLARMSGNPAIELFLEIGYTFGMLSPSVTLFQKPEERLASRERQRGLCDAILASDPDVARLMMKRRSELMAGWISQLSPAGRQRDVSGHGAG